jgi:diacylglycerol kinase (ATP)
MCASNEPLRGQSRGDVVSDPFSLSSRVRSFKYAFRGIGVMLRMEHNAWIHAAATIAVLGLGFWLDVSAGDWCWLVLAMTAVWASEGINTAVERLADAAVPEAHPLVEQAKDAAAGAVLISALGSAVIGLLVLGPPLLAELG